MNDHSEHTTKLFVPLQGHALSHAIFCKTIKIKPSKYREFVFALVALYFDVHRLSHGHTLTT